MRVAVIGASGYTGAELIRLLCNHPEAEIVFLTSETYKGVAVGHVYPNLIGIEEKEFVSINDKGAKEEVSLVFVALPHGKSMEVVPGIVADGVNVIDLSGDFRLKDANDYEKWYGQPHKASDLLDVAVYGLCELNKRKIEKASLISNPGCYPTSVLLATAPLISGGSMVCQNIIVDSMSGVSGCGRTADENVHYCKCSDSVSSYKVGGVHQHIPEMEKAMEEMAGDEVKISFTPHIIPTSRGIYSTIYADLFEMMDLDDIHTSYVDFYKDEYFVQIMGKGEYPQLKAVVGSNFCHIGLAIDKRCSRLIITSAIDNLIKGAAGQAVQNMNIMSGWEESLGLANAGLYP